MSASTGDGTRDGDDGTSGESFKWSEFFEWSENAAEFVTKPHDRPAPPVRSPCVSWGFSIRPKRGRDPIDALNKDDEETRKKAWIAALNDALSVFDDDRFVFPFDQDLPQLHFDAKSQLGGQFGRDKKNVPPIQIVSKHFPIVWRGVPGEVQVETHTEFASFLFIFSPRLYLPDWLERIKGPGYHVAHGDTPIWRDLRDHLGLVGKETAQLAEQGLFPGAVDRAQSFLYGEFWDAFAADLVTVFKQRHRDRKLSGGWSPDEPIFPGEVFASLRIVAARCDDSWREGKDDEVALDPMAPQEAFDFLKRRVKVIDRLFPPSPQREFVANLALKSKCVFVSPLGSTITHQLETEDYAAKYDGDDVAPTPPSRALILLKSRPDSHQLGRLIERLHALQTFRIAALFDYNRLLDVGSELRRLGFELDKFIVGSRDRSPTRTKRDLNHILSKLQELGEEIRGGLSYRVSRSTLYVASFERRMDEMSTTVIDTWQPYDEFIQRRLKRTFDYVADLGERRNRLLQRLQLFIERLQWDELHDVQHETRRTLQSTDVIAYVGVITTGAAPTEILIGRDLRPSSPRIADACAAATRAAGVAVVDCGVLPTPALALEAARCGAPAIMVTGSHIPFDRNGLKFYRPEGEITKADELGVLAALEAPPVETESAPGDARKADAVAPYLARVRAFGSPAALAGWRIGVYQHSAAGRDLLPDALGALGATAVPLGRSDDFVPIDTEAVRPEDAALARGWCAAERLDALVTTDGDGDRPLIADETGAFLRGDLVGVLTARALGADAVATPISSNTALERSGWFARIARTRIGSPYVIEAMERLSTEGARLVVGYEANGGFLLGGEAVLATGVLAPLPTRDSLTPILAILTMAAADRVTLSALAARAPARATASERLTEIAQDRSGPFLGILAADAVAQADLVAPIGASVVEAVDLTDGVRLTLPGDEIVHLRPSGNAPELRCYAEAATSERAAEIVARTLAAVSKRLAAG